MNKVLTAVIIAGALVQGCAPKPAAVHPSPPAESVPITVPTAKSARKESIAETRDGHPIIVSSDSSVVIIDGKVQPTTPAQRAGFDAAMRKKYGSITTTGKGSPVIVGSHLSDVTITTH